MALGQNKGFGHSIGLGGFSDWIAPRRNAMLGLASGLLASPDFSSGLSTGFARAADGRQADDAWAERQREAAEREKQIADATALKAKYADFFTQQGRTDIAQGIADGIVDPGSTYMDFITPKDPVKKEFRDVNGDIIAIDPFTGETSVAYDGPAAAPAMPTSYQEYLLSQQDPGYGASLNSSTSRPPTEGQRRNIQLSTVTAPELKAVEDNWDELTNPANQAIGANTPLGAPGFALTSPGYQQATSALRTIAQSYLYSVSGAAATNEETQKIIDSVTPKFGESKASADAKKARIKIMVESIKAAGGATSPDAISDPTNVDDILTKYGL